MKNRSIHPSWLLLLALAANAHAQESAPAASRVLYRCTDAKGNLTIQNAPCPAGMREQKQVVGEVKTAPLPGRPAFVPNSAPPPDFHPSATANSRPDPALQYPQNYQIVDSAAPDADAKSAAGNCDGGAPAAHDGPRLPPPALFECTAYDKNSYLSEDAQPPPRRLPLQTTGLDGDPRKGVAEAYELKRDSCVRVPDAKLCEAWRKRLGETEVAWRYGKLQNVDANKAEYQRVQRIVNDTCR